MHQVLKAVLAQNPFTSFLIKPDHTVLRVDRSVAVKLPITDSDLFASIPDFTRRARRTHNGVLVTIGTNRTRDIQALYCLLSRSKSPFLCLTQLEKYGQIDSGNYHDTLSTGCITELAGRVLAYDEKTLVSRKRCIDYILNKCYGYS